MKAELTVLIPVIDEEEGLRRLLPELKAILLRMGVSHEIIVVDGGSSDRTVEVSEGEGARVVRQRAPGFGAALREGFEKSSGGYILTMDGDGSHPAGMLPRLWESRAGHDLVIASRFIPGGSAEMPRIRYALSRFLNLATRWFLGFPVRDASSGLRLYRASAVRGLALVSRDFSVQQEILARALKAGGKAAEIPFHYDPRLGGSSKARTLPLGMSYLRMFFQLKLLLEGPGPGALAFVLALGLGMGLWGIGWGLPGPQRLRAFPEKLRSTPEAARRLAEGWSRLYEGIRRSHREMSPEEPVAYVKGVLEIAPGWDFPPGNLANSYRSLLLQSQQPDEKKSFIILSQMRPWKLDFKPLYVQYGGAFIYPLGAFLKALSWLGAVVLTPDLGHYLQHPEDMRRIYFWGRIFILLFELGSLWLLYDLGRKLSGWRTGFCAALFFALCPSVVVHSHLLKPHPYAAFWALASLRWMLAAYGGGALGSYVLCGLSGGMAAGSNLTLAPLLGLPAAALLARAGKGVLAAESRRALAGIFCAGAVCILANPYLVFSYRDFTWETEIYAPLRLRLTFQGLGLMASRVAEGMGPCLGALALAGSVAALWRKGEGRLLGAVLWLVFAVLWARFWGLAGDPASLRLYLPLLGLGCLLGADILWSLPWTGLRAAVLAAVVLDSGLRAWAYLENMRIDSGPRSTRAQAADWIEAHVPAGASVGLLRYPQPAHTPPFRYDRYRLVFFERPEALPAARTPEYLVVDEPGLASIDNWAEKEYDVAAAFAPLRAGWARVTDTSSYINGGMFVYRRKEALR